MSNQQFFPLAASQYNLRRLLVIRAIVFACQMLALAYAYFSLSLSLNYSLLCMVLLFNLFMNGAVSFRLSKNWLVGDKEFLGHLLFDILSLALLLYLSGGASNPFVSYFLVPVTISAAILPWTYTWIVAGASLLSYSLLLFFFHPLPEIMAADMDMSMDGQGGIPNLHVIGMWFNFLVSAVLITYFVVKMAEEIRKQATKITSFREDNLRDEQILAVATQAAGTAHELGTPLSTVAVILSEMEQDHSKNEALQKDISLIKEQISRCKKSLKELVTQADIRNGSGLKENRLFNFVQQILEQWRLLRPEVVLSFSCPNQETNNSPSIFVEATLQQAIVNILNNAADASPSGIDVTLFWDNTKWVLSIRDFGEGINQELAQHLGSNFISTKKDGLGLGLVLSQASINRLGGAVSLHQHKEKGTIISIELPLVKGGIV